MESIPRKPLRAACHCSLALLTCLFGAANARPMLLPSERFPGPWLEITRDQGHPHSQRSFCLHSGPGTRIVAQPWRISLVLHIGRAALAKLARTTHGAHRARHAPA